MNKHFSIFQQLSWFFMIIVIVGVIATGVMTNITLRSVEKRLPGILLAELNDLSLVLENLSDVVTAARIAKDKPSSDNLNLLREKIEPVYKGIVRLRESYVLDNLIQASAFHTVVAPAIADLQIWLSEGVSGLAPENKTVVTIIFVRIDDAYQKARLLNRESRNRAQEILVEQQQRLGHFVFNANLLFVLTIIIAFGMVYLLIRQYVLQLRESKAQSDLRDQSDLLTSLFENITLGITVWGKNGKLIFSNKGFTAITGYSKLDIKSLEDWFLKAYPDQEYRNQVLAEWNKPFAQDEAIRQFKVTSITNEIKDIEFRGAFLKDGRALVTMSDNTWRIQAEEDKIKAQKVSAEQNKLALVGKIAGKMAHDFNNILGIVMGNTELALIDCKDPQIKRTLELIFEQTIRGRNLTKNLVAFAKDQEPKQKYFSVKKKIELVLNLLKKDLEGIDTARIHDIGEEYPVMPDLLADPGMVEHAFVNIIQNAIHATSMVEQPKIIIRTFHKEENIYIEIEDNGCGIPEEALDRIYEPAFTLKGSCDITNSYKPGIKGTGYGMANVKKYIEQHKGNILIDSKVGKGTKIIISFPVIKKELTQKEIIEIQKDTFYSGKHILLVEDEQAISDVQYKILTHEPCNHKVDIASKGQMAIDLFGRNKYDFISLDYVLPGGLNGMDVYKYIRQVNETIPILFVSGNLNFLESIKELKHKDFCVDHVSKPCQNKDYIQSINDLLGKIENNT
jgi:signal transduction histidine kinase/CheY-like chemotaxis protein